MNKNLFKTFAIAAMAVLAGACAKEQVGPGEGAMVEATFDVDVPGVEVSTKGLSDAASVNELICQVFLNDGNYTPVPDLNQTVTVTDKHAKVTFNLVKGQKYSFAFWAQAKGTGYYDTGNLRAVKINVDAVKANEPKMDAYFAQKNFQAFSTATTKDTKITLYRAVAQVNFGTINSDRKDKLGIVKSKIKLTEVPTVFDVIRGNMDDAYSVPAAIEFKENALVEEKLLAADKKYDYVATCYVFAHKNQKLTDATATFWVDIRDSKGNFTTTRTVSAPNAPYKRNMRTNILGDLLTVNQDFNIVVDPVFHGGDKIYDAVSANLEAGKEVTLSEDYSVAGESKGVTLDVGVTSVLNLNGKKFSNENAVTDNKAALQVHGDLTINGDGEVYCKGGADNNAIIVEQGGHLVINGGTYNVGKANSGKSNATIFVMGPDKYGRNGSVEINGGVFMAEAGSDSDATPATPFVLNQHDDITVNCFSVKGGTFVGFNPASVNEAKGAITSFVAEGYKSVETTYNGKQAWEVVAIPPVTTQDGLNAAIADVAEGETATVYLGAGEFTTYDNASLKGKNVTVSYVGAGADKTTFAVGTDNDTKSEANGDYSLDGVTKASFKNMTIKVNNKDYRGYIRVKELEFENCVFENRISYWGVGEVTFKNCTFNQTANDYNLWTYSGTKFVFENCTFNAPGKFINVYKQQNIPFSIIVRDCKFIASVKKYAAVNLKYGETDGAGVSYRIDFYGTNVAQTEAGDPFPLYGCSDGVTTPNAQVFINDLLVWKTNDEFPTE